MAPRSVIEVEVPRESTDAGASPSERTGAPPPREIRHEYTRSLPPLLSQLGTSLLVSTYQAGKVAAVGVAAGELTLSYHNFERAMGLALTPDGLAAAARAQVWFLHAAPHPPAPPPAPARPPPARQTHDSRTRPPPYRAEPPPREWAGAPPPPPPPGGRGRGGGDLWLVTPAFGSLCTLDGKHSFVPRWRPP